MVINRIGDVGLALAMFVIFSTFKSLDFTTIFSLVPYVGSETISVFGTT